MIVKRTERGWGGHFICAARCLFRRNTLLEHGETRVVVSTVGAMRGGVNATGDVDTIGFNRYYETMVFHADFEAPYWEADVGREITLNGPWAIDKCERETDLQANDMHEAAVSEISARMIAGEIA